MAKVLKYSGFQTLCDAAFALFVVAWFVARHVCYLMICWSIYAHVPALMPVGCYSSITGAQLSTDGGSDIASNILQSFIAPGDPVCYNNRIRVAFLSLLLVLQGITILWFAMIVRVAYKVVLGQPADDSRSDDEGAADEAEEDVNDDEAELEGADAEALAAAQAQAPLGPTGAPPLELTVGVEDVHLPRRVSVRYRKSNGHSSGFPLAASDRKELLGRIGCDKPS